MTGTAGPHKMTLPEMEAYHASHRLRFHTADGQPCQHVAITMDTADFDALDQIGRFLTWACGRESEIRAIGKGRRG